MNRLSPEATEATRDAHHRALLASPSAETEAAPLAYDDVWAVLARRKDGAS